MRLAKYLAVAAVAAFPIVFPAAPGTGSVPPRSSVAPSTATAFTLMWSQSIGTQVTYSSPAYGYDEGTPIVAATSWNGRVFVFDAVTGAPMPGWQGGQAATLYPGQTAPINSSPTIANLDGPNEPPSIIVGFGSERRGTTNGGVMAWNMDGTVRFRFHTLDNFDASVFSTPAVGPVTAPGRDDIVFGSYDHYIYAITPAGRLVPGFPIQRADTIWSSPALVPTSSGVDDIVIGGDSTGLKGPSGLPCYGGWLTDYRWVPAKRAPVLRWEHCIGQSVWSSPAIGVINSTNRAVAVVGTSFNPVYASDPATHELFAFYVGTGRPVPGWPVQPEGASFPSPVIAN